LLMSEVPLYARKRWGITVLFKVHRLLYHPTLGMSVIKKKRRC